MYSSLQRRKETNVDRITAATPQPPAASIPRYLRSNVSPQPRHAPYPYGTTLHGALGMPVPGAALIDPEGCAARDVPAYTDGQVTHFASAQPPLEVAAHEATHQLQHASKTRDAGLGAEGHAHGVAQAVAADQSDGGLLGGGGDSVDGVVHHYTVFPVADQTASGEWQAGNEARVGDSGLTVTTTQRRDLWADPGLVASAEKILEAKKSGIGIATTGGSVSGFAPDGSGWNTLSKVEAKILGVNPFQPEEYWTDCGRASREVQGPSGSDTSPKGLYQAPSGALTETSASYDPATYRDEIYMAGGLGATPGEAHDNYLLLTPAEKDAFDKQYKINRYAEPGVGESFVARRDDALTGAAFNWHWAAVIMVAGPDRVTFENFARPGTDYESTNELWFFETYGPPTKAGQTFYDKEQTDVGAPGMNTTIMSARTQPDPSADIPAAAAMSTAGLIAQYAASTRQEERMALEAEMRRRWIKVDVDVISTEDSTGADEVYCLLSNGSDQHKTNVVDLNDGDSNTYWVPLKYLAPVIGAINLKVYDEDWPDADDLIVYMSWPSPYSAFTNTRSYDEANYRVTISFL